jgi:hypothetical protein
MNQTAIAILAGFVAGVVGGYFGQSLAPSRGSEMALEADAADDLRRDVDDLKQRLRRGGGSAATLSVRDPSGRSLEAQADGAALTAAAEDALLVRVDERVAAAVEKKIADLQAQDGGLSGRSKRPEKRKLTLAQASAELELSAQQEDELRRIYADSERKFLAMLAGPDGDPEEVKREIQDAAQTPGGPQKLIGKYMPNVISNIGTIISMQAERESAIVKAVGPKNAKRLDNEFEVKEADFLGLGGGSMNIGAQMEMDER